MPQPVWPDFSGKAAIVTGGGAGFGEGFCRAFADRGAAIGVFDVDLDNARRVAAAIESGGGRALAVKCDVADENAVQHAVDAVVHAFGGVDILINNAGLHVVGARAGEDSSRAHAGYTGPFGKLPRSEVRRVFDVNILGVVNCTLSCRDSMAARGGGVIVNISSVGGTAPNSPYGVSKLAVRGLTIAFAQELKGERIRVNCIAPGLMATPSVLETLGEKRFNDRLQKRQLIPRRGEVEDIVNAALFFCSDESSFVTGEMLKVSGGDSLWI
jgi:NAD(P)-dependent dehydrogenase (short-subunit alcohol dehydrogenase family)